MRAHIKALWVRNGKTRLVIFLAVLFFIPAIALPQAGQQSLAKPLLQEATTTPTPTASATLTVTPGDQTTTATLTATATLTVTPGNQTTTVTPSATVSPTSGSATATWTASPTTQPGITLSPTATSATQTGLPSLTATSPVTQVITATATLAPFPTLTFIYPQISETAALLSEPRLPGNPALSKSETAPINWIRLVVCAFVVLLWIVLAGWFILSQRRVE